MSKTIKIIGLLNKIADGEEVPKKIKFHGLDFELDELERCYIHNIHNDNDLDMTTDGLKYSQLNDIAEIIEEQEELDKLEIDDNGFIHTNNGAWKGRKLDVAFAKLINKLAEEVKNIKEKQ